MKQLIIFLTGIFIFSCHQQSTETEIQLTTHLELHSIGFYDHFETFDPPLNLEVNSEPMLLNLISQDSIAVKFHATQRTVEYHDGDPTEMELAGGLMFMERIKGEWNLIGGGEPFLNSIRFDKWTGQEIHMSNCDTNDDYFSVDYRYRVVKK